MNSGWRLGRKHPQYICAHHKSGLGSSQSLLSRPPRNGADSWPEKSLGEEDGVSGSGKTGFSGFLATVLKKGLGVQQAITLRSKRLPGRGANQGGGDDGHSVEERLGKSGQGF